MKICKVNTRRGSAVRLNAKDLVTRSVEAQQAKERKNCIQAAAAADPPAKKKRRTKEDRLKEEREDKQNSFLLFLEKQQAVAGANTPKK